MSYTSLPGRRIFAGVLVFLFVCLSFSCSKNYLNVTEPSAISPDVFPSKVQDLDQMLNDVYGRLRSAFFHYDNFSMAGIGLDHTADQGINGAYNDFYLNNVQVNNTYNTGLWTMSYEAISRANAFLEALEKFRAKGVTASEEGPLNIQEGQGRFLRALYYFYLVQLYGEVPLTTDADRARLAVPLWDKIPQTVSATNKERATIGEVWDFIVSDLEKAETLMAGKTSWDAANQARATLWSVKAFLAKAYLFSLQYDKARDKAKEVIEQSGKSLLPYDTYRNMFNGDNEFNAESLFEINFTNDSQNDIFTNVQNASSQYELLISPSFVNDDGTETPNGFGNLFIHDANIRRFGFIPNAVTSAEQKDPAYIAQSLAIRANKQADPRLYVGTMQPYVDSMFINNTWKKSAKSYGEGFDLSQNKAWGHRKFTLLSRFWTDNFGYAGFANMYFLRMADIYLLYAEALIRTGDDALGLEYINRVKRRAYGMPVDTPSPFDYPDLTAPTGAAPADHLANDPLKYERWAELFAEGQWWFDVRRWRIGDKEAAYYGKVKAGNLTWNDNKYALPIPEQEMNNNNLIQKQNNGY